MIRNSIDYSEYRIQRSNFEFWDRLEICIILLICTVIEFLEDGECIFSETVSNESDFQVDLKENVNYQLWVVDLNGPEKISVKISKGSYVAFEDTFMLMHSEGDYLPYHPKFSVKESEAYQVHVKPIDSGTVRLGIIKSRLNKLLVSQSGRVKI